MHIWGIPALLAALAWMGFACICKRLTNALAGDVLIDLAWGAAQVYVRVVHRLRVEGLENVPRGRDRLRSPRPLVLVSNHTAGVDPVLIQTVFPYQIRWMMMRSMMIRTLDPLWEWLGIIPVEQNGRDSQALRSALRHLKQGGVLGIFAEGGIERPSETIMPYEPGVGLLALKSGASVLPVVVRGTPRSDKALVSFFRPSRAVVRFLPVREYSASGLDSAAVALDLEMQAAATLGWVRGPRRGPGRTGSRE